MVESGIKNIRVKILRELIHGLDNDFQLSPNGMGDLMILTADRLIIGCVDIGNERVVMYSREAQ